MNEIQFTRNIDKVLVSAAVDALSIIGAWHVVIRRDKAISYVKNYNKSPSEGFYEHGGSVTLSHEAGKITFATQEADAIIALIREVYMSKGH